MKNVKKILFTAPVVLSTQALFAKPEESFTMSALASSVTVGASTGIMMGALTTLAGTGTPLSVAGAASGAASGAVAGAIGYAMTTAFGQ
ncbi:hypothetical protein DEM91_10130 [Prevotella sp. TCVGH]|jgi:hypothetical protein|uniref:hypothetical protein n=1 Tax=Prevotella sp. TCVGH TaxID=2182433 RepID=UPI00201E006D|nr:hypothetical protein [Prevotella sp. TCVGH]MCL6748964.1 hypothetical protein [Prevotella sp. TCVGH]